MTQFDNKTVLVTGASRGVGEAVARHFAALGAGVVLFACSGDAVADIAVDIEAAGGTALALTGDVACREDVERAVAQAVGASAASISSSTTPPSSSPSVISPTPTRPPGISPWTST